jgi:superfamily II DNA helicase RecQ
MTWTENKDKFLKDFKEGDSIKRIVIASTALSMGVNFSDVRYVVNWGPARTLLDYHQEAGRDGNPSHSVIIYHGSQTSHCEADV